MENKASEIYRASRIRPYCKMRRVALNLKAFLGPDTQVPTLVLCLLWRHAHCTDSRELAPRPTWACDENSNEPGEQGELAPITQNLNATTTTSLSAPTRSPSGWKCPRAVS